MLAKKCWHFIQSVFNKTIYNKNTSYVYGGNSGGVIITNKKKKNHFCGGCTGRGPMQLPLVQWKGVGGYKHWGFSQALCLRATLHTHHFIKVISSTQIATSTANPIHKSWLTKICSPKMKHIACIRWWWSYCSKVWFITARNCKWCLHVFWRRS